MVRIYNTMLKIAKLLKKCLNLNHWPILIIKEKTFKALIPLHLCYWKNNNNWQTLIFKAFTFVTKQ